MTKPLIRDEKAYAIRQETMVGSHLFTVAVPLFDARGEIGYIVMSVRDSVSDSLIFTGKSTVIVTGAHTSQVNILYESDEMKQVVDSIQRIGGTDAKCLIIGGADAGKTALAKYMHQLNHRRDKPFISVNCASLPRELRHVVERQMVLASNEKRPSN